MTERNDFRSLLSSQFVKNRLDQMTKLTKETKKEAGFLIYVLPDRVVVNNPSLGEEDCLLDHEPALGSLGKIYPPCQGFFMEEGGQVVAFVHSAESHHLSKLIYPSTGDAASLWYLMTSNEKLAARDSSYLGWINPLMIIGASGGYCLAQFLVDRDFLNNNPNYLENLNMDPIFSIELAVSKALNMYRSCRTIQLKMRRDKIGISLLTKQCTLETLDRALQKFQSFISFPEGEDEEEAWEDF